MSTIGDHLAKALVYEDSQCVYIYLYLYIRHAPTRRETEKRTPWRTTMDMNNNGNIDRL